MEEVYNTFGDIVKGHFVSTKENLIYPLEGRRLHAWEKICLKLSGTLENCQLLMCSYLIHTMDITKNPIKSIDKNLKRDFLVSKGTMIYFESELIATDEPFVCDIYFELISSQETSGGTK